MSRTYGIVSATPSSPASTPSTGAASLIAEARAWTAGQAWATSCEHVGAVRCRIAFTGRRGADRLAGVVSRGRILGAIEGERRDGRSAPVPRGGALSLLALLLVHRGATVSPDRIVDELWDGDGPQNARNAVQVVASRLRAAVGDDLLVSEAHGYGVRVTDVDADRFEDALRRGREQLER